MDAFVRDTEHPIPTELVDQQMLREDVRWLVKTLSLREQVRAARRRANGAGAGEHKVWRGEGGHREDRGESAAEAETAEQEPGGEVLRVRSH